MHRRAFFSGLAAVVAGAATVAATKREDEALQCVNTQCSKCLAVLECTVPSGMPYSERAAWLRAPQKAHCQYCKKDYTVVWAVR